MQDILIPRRTSFLVKMGAGASFDNITSENEGSRRFFCHSCQRNMSYSGQEDSSNLLCPYCTSSFIEEMPPHNSELESIRRRRHDLQDLSSDQSRRLASAAIMLRLLEAQLQGEVQSLHEALLERRNLQQQNDHAKCMSPMMKKKLRRSVMDKDTICSQPSCPICSEDFSVGESQLCMPCSHFYHEACVVPWLDAKKTCPICRYELTNEVPSVLELERFSEEELRRLYSEEKIEEDNEEQLEESPQKNFHSRSMPNEDLHSDFSGGMGGKLISDTPRAPHEPPPGIDKHNVATELHNLMIKRKNKADKITQDRQDNLASLPARADLTHSLLGMREIFGGGGSEVEAMSSIRARRTQERDRQASFSSRSLREIINEAEAEEAAREHARRRIAAIVAGQNAAFGEDIIGIPQQQTDQDYQDDASLMSALIGNQAARVLREGRENGFELDDDEAQVDATPRHISLQNAMGATVNLRPFALAPTNPRMIPISSYLSAPIGTPTGRTMTIGRPMPQTFVVRSSGDGISQIERREALRQAMQEMTPPHAG